MADEALQGVQAPNLVQTIGQLYALKSAKQDQQLQALKIQQAQQGVNDDAAERTALSSNVQMGSDGTPTLNRQGTLGQLYQTAPMRALSLGQQFTQQDIANRKATADYQKTQFENQKAHANLVGSLANGVTDQTSYDNAVKQGISSGVLQPGELPAVYDPQIVNQIRQQAQTVTEHLTAIQKQQEAAETSRHNTATEGNAAATLAETAQRDKQTAQYQGGELRNSAVRNSIEAQNASTNAQRLGFEYNMSGGGNTNLSGDDYLKTLPTMIQNRVKAAANGDIPIPGGGRGPAAAFAAAVQQYDPSYTTARYTAKQSFKTGPDATSVVQLGTAMKHADNALSNSANVGFAPLLNHDATPADAAYNKDVQYLTGEVGKLVTGGALTVDEGHKLTSGLDSVRQGIRDSAIKESLDLLSGKTSAIFQKYKTATGQDLPVDQYFDKDTQGRLQKYGITPAPASSGGAGMVTVQIPGLPPGQIPAGGLTKFKADHPNAKVTQ